MSSQFIEPRDIYDKAIIKGKRGKPVYSYYRLVLLTFEEMGLDTVCDAIEWVDYNMACVLDEDQIKYVRKHEKEIYDLMQITGEEETF